MKYIARYDLDRELITPYVAVAVGVNPAYVASDLGWRPDTWREITEEERLAMDVPSDIEIERQKRKYEQSIASFRDSICAPGAPYIPNWFRHCPLESGDTVTTPGEPDQRWYYRAVGIKNSGLLFGSCISSDVVPGGTVITVEGAERITCVFWRLS